MNDGTPSRRSRLEALLRASSQLGATLDLTELLNLVMDSIIKLTGAERGYIILEDQQGRGLRPVAARNVDQETIGGDQMQFSRTVVERTMRTGQALLTDNAQQDERLAAHDSISGLQLRSILCAPLRTRGRVIGAAYVDNRFHTGVFAEEDRALLETFATQAALAIDNARLFTETSRALARRVQELTLFQQLDQDLNRSLELDQVLEQALEWAVRLTQSDSGAIGLAEADEAQPGLRVLAQRGMVAPLPARLAATHAVWLEARQTRTPFQVAQVDGHGAQLAVPVVREQQAVGLILLGRARGISYSDEDTAFAHRLADRAAVAIENSRLYEAVNAVSKAKSDFVSVVTHELRLPLTSIKGYADLLGRDMVGSLNEQQQRFLGVIQRNVTRMSTLIDDLSDINRIESKRMTLEPEAFPLEEVIAEVVGSFSEAITAKKQALRVAMPEALPDVYADRTRTAQVLSNLLSNAHKYTPEGGSLRVEAAADGPFIKVAVIDTGVGISAEDQAQLFTQFFRSGDPNVREQAGWGLGLFIVKMLVEAQRGQISCRSEQGDGSTFAFTLPAASWAASRSDATLPL
jgi:signal transduction histidine kinase